MVSKFASISRDDLRWGRASWTSAIGLPLGPFQTIGPYEVNVQRVPQFGEPIRMLLLREPLSEMHLNSITEAMNHVF